MTKAEDILRLTENLAQLSLLDHKRKDNAVDMPEVNEVVEFEKIVCGITGLSLYMNNKSLLSKLVTVFGAVPVVLAKAWELMQEHNDPEDWPEAAERKHLCWATHKLKQYSEETNMCVTMKGSSPKPDEKTFRKWTDFFIDQLSSLEHVVIDWDNRFKNDEGDDVLSGVDTTDSPFQQIKISHPTDPNKKIVNKALYSYKLRGPGLRYEVAIALGSDNIVWVNGPFPPGDYNDITIFRLGLMQMLGHGEKVLADQIYESEAPEKVICENMMGEMTEDKMDFIKRGCGRIETIMSRFKQYECLSKKFKGRGDADERVLKHSKMFRAVAVLIQIALDLGLQELYDLDLLGE